jgi:hypothetical protein
MFGLFGSLAFLGLGICVFGWGLGYKLSLYDQSQTPSHQIPNAKLLSRDEKPTRNHDKNYHQSDLHRAYICFLVSVAGY